MAALVSSTGADSEKWSNEINFGEIDEDLAAFQEDELVQQALHRGVDLDKYGKELERDLRQVRNRSMHILLAVSCANTGS
jgi:3-keto-L-gulonate-6-phosphate decarboxylase